MCALSAKAAKSIIFQQLKPEELFWNFRFATNSSKITIDDYKKSMEMLNLNTQIALKGQNTD